ncbi:hypothetical protein HYPSUDRAFT_207543 [Hypholoma sublateritium FD-334 SS-4]|uniref:Uncharacterized protein n=1 Tax=Hypholoma sublateritium (strain FD-334 SS-4) TaxID=945553 RepID=A0A0D2KMI4_HYPSF|nr:hypothetical protein HYPSUDRAFT_207543 [Hypholoma sublateritium FD-334 SS-4]
MSGLTKVSVGDQLCDIENCRYDGQAEVDPVGTRATESTTKVDLIINPSSAINNTLKDQDFDVKQEQSFFGSFFTPKLDSENKGLSFAMEVPPPTSAHRTCSTATRR